MLRNYQYFLLLFFVVSCPSLTPPASGSLTVTTAGTTTIATYSCQSGYKLVGTVERVCSDAGMWDSTDPTCGETQFFEFGKSMKVLGNNCSNILFIFKTKLGACKFVNR